MIYLGKEQTLKVVKTTDSGVYLSSGSPILPAQLKKDPSLLDVERILLPKNQVPEHTSLDDEITVFVYKDSEDRPIATTCKPKLTLGSIAKLTVKEVTNIGVFLDWNLAKDLLLPFKEQTYRPNAGEEVIVALYIDKSCRLCATMKVYHYLSTNSPYQKDETVSGRVYEILDNFGAFVAVDDQYSALIPKKEFYGNNIQTGDTIEARITTMHPDGKLELTIRQKAHIQMNTDSKLIHATLEKAEDGFLPYHDKTDPEVIKSVFNLSKNSFKRAIGHLMKEGIITITGDGIRLNKKGD